jgi:hypothetical protein
MKTSYILFFTLFTLNIMWGKPGGGGALASWLIEPPVVDLAPTGCTNCSMVNLAIQIPTYTLCALYESTNSLFGLSPLLDGSNVCALSQEPFPATVEKSSLGAHGSLQTGVSFPATIEPEVENLAPLGANS